MRLVLAPWEWHDDGQDQFWRKPGGDHQGGCLDFRTVTEAGSPGPAASGLGLFAYEDLPPGIKVAADLGDDPLARMKVAERNALADALGLERSALSDAPLAQVLAEQVLGSLADPSGAVRTKPLRMNGRGMKLHLKGFGQIYQHPLDKAHPVYDQTLAVRKLDYERNRALLLDRLPRPEALAVLQRWTGWDMRALDATEDELLPQRHLSDGSREPSTALTESWPTNGSTISSGQDQPWNKDLGSDVRVSSGELTALGSDTETQAYGRCTSDLSSDDHSHAATARLLNDTSNVASWVTVRKIDSTAKTFYGLRVRSDVNASYDAIYKAVTGTYTELAATADQSGDGTHAFSHQADGSSISGETPQGTLGPVTDTDITGHLQCGYHFRVFSSGGEGALDDHTMQDLITASPTDEVGLDDSVAVSLVDDLTDVVALDDQQTVKIGWVGTLLDIVELDDDVREIPWDETFESVGYDEPWSGGETMTGAATIDSDADAPSGAPSWWGPKALRTEVGDEEEAYVTETDIGADADDSWLTLGFVLTSENLPQPDSFEILRVRTENADDVFRLSVSKLDPDGDLELNPRVYQNDGNTGVAGGPLFVGRFVVVQFRWNQVQDLWEVYRDGSRVGNGQITQTPAADDHRMRDIRLGSFGFGLQNVPGGAVVHFGRFTISANDPGYLPALTGQLIVTSFNDIKG